MWDLPRPGLQPVSPALAGRFSTTAPPGKPYFLYFIRSAIIFVADILNIFYLLITYPPSLLDFINYLLTLLIVLTLLINNSSRFFWDFYTEIITPVNNDSLLKLCF